MTGFFYFKSIMKSKFVHTNIIAEDWKKLSEFYIEVFDCKIVPPIRSYNSKALDDGTGIKEVRLQGVHLKLPGYNNDGPTLEIFTYTPQDKRINKPVNSPGFGHIAFSVDNVEDVRRLVLNNGGSAVGKTVILETSAGDKVTWCYLKDPEGNVIELQSWERVKPH